MWECVCSAVLFFVVFSSTGMSSSSTVNLCRARPIQLVTAASIFGQKLDNFIIYYTRTHPSFYNFAYFPPKSKLCSMKMALSPPHNKFNCLFYSEVYSSRSCDLQIYFAAQTWCCWFNRRCCFVVWIMQIIDYVFLSRIRYSIDCCSRSSNEKTQILILFSSDVHSHSYSWLNYVYLTVHGAASRHYSVLCCLIFLFNFYYLSFPIMPPLGTDSANLRCCNLPITSSREAFSFAKAKKALESYLWRRWYALCSW